MRNWKNTNEPVGPDAKVLARLPEVREKRSRVAEKIDAALQQIEQDVFQPRLGTHKLSGNLAGLLACSCGYDCRIVFALEKDPPGGEDVILLIDIGTHDEVY